MAKYSKKELELMRRWGMTEADLKCEGGDIATQLEDLARHEFQIYRYGFAIQVLHDQVKTRHYLREEVALKLVLATVDWEDCDFYIAVCTLVMAWKRGVHINGVTYRGDELGVMIVEAETGGVQAMLSAYTDFKTDHQELQSYARER